VGVDDPGGDVVVPEPPIESPTDTDGRDKDNEERVVGTESDSEVEGSPAEMEAVNEMEVSDGDRVGKDKETEGS
jgi:hypothetical protein